MKKMDEIIQKEIESGKIELGVKDRCFICGEKIGSKTDPLARYCKQGNTCDECSVCSDFHKSKDPEKIRRYKIWCSKLELLKYK